MSAAPASNPAAAPARARARAESRPFDPVIVFVAGCLMTLGVVMVYSSSATVQGPAFDWRHWWQTPLRHGAFAAAGFIVMLITAHVDYRALGWRRPGAGWRAGLPTLLVAALLVAVLAPGVGAEVLGARRQILIPGLGFGFQPSEVAKVFIVVWVAALLTRVRRVGPARAAAPASRPRVLPIRGERTGAPLAAGLRARPAPPPPRETEAWVEAVDPRSFVLGFLPVLLTGGALIGLTIIEDFGTAALMGVILFVMMYVGGARLTHLGLVGLVGAAGGAAMVIAEPYRVQRIATFLSEAPDPRGAGYQISQALMAIGSGGWWGRGLGAGVQKYGYLPQDNNDFILAIICEELGVAGGVAVAVLFLVLLLRGYRLSATAPDRFGRLVALGLTLTICLQAAFNFGVITNSVPTKGISLPFVSQGGSGVLFLGFATGLLASIGRRGGAADEG